MQNGYTSTYTTTTAPVYTNTNTAFPQQQFGSTNTTLPTTTWQAPINSTFSSGVPVQAGGQGQYFDPTYNNIMTGINGAPLLNNTHPGAVSREKSELELQKRMLENDRETQLKYADMESDKQKKFEDKAEKQREKAAKWKGRGMEFMVHTHEKKASTLELKAHEHYIAAEQYKLEGKKFEERRKVLEPEKDKKDDKTKGKPGAKPTDSKDKKVEEKKVEKKEDGQTVEKTKTVEKKDEGSHSHSHPSSDAAHTPSLSKDTPIHNAQGEPVHNTAV